MEKRKFAIVPTEDEIMFLSGKKSERSHAPPAALHMTAAEP